MTANLDTLAAIVAVALHGSAFARPARWPSAVVVIRADSRARVTSRGDHASWLIANDLGPSARECVRRRVPPGSILCWLEIDHSEVAAAGFYVFDLAAAVRAAASTD